MRVCACVSLSSSVFMFGLVTFFASYISTSHVHVSDKSLPPRVVSSAGRAPTQKGVSAMNGPSGRFGGDRG